MNRGSLWQQNLLRVSPHRVNKPRKVGHCDLLRRGTVFCFNIFQIRFSGGMVGIRQLPLIGAQRCIKPAVAKRFSYEFLGLNQKR